MNPLMSAAKSGNVASVRSLLQSKEYPVEATDSNGYTALCAAACGCDVNTCKQGCQQHAQCALELIAAGAAVNASTRNGQTPLIIAAHTACADFVAALLLHGANVICCDKDGLNALHAAARYFNAEAMKLLVRAPNAAIAMEATTHDDGMAPLMLAADIASPSICEALIAGGANVNAVSPSTGKTALMFAVHPQGKTFGGDRDNTATLVPALLRRAGADESMRDAQGRSVADYEQERRNYNAGLERDRAMEQQRVEMRSRNALPCTPPPLLLHEMLRRDAQQDQRAAPLLGPATPPPAKQTDSGDERCCCCVVQ